MSGWSTINIPSMLGFGIPKNFTAPTNVQKSDAMQSRALPYVETSQPFKSSRSMSQRESRSNLKVKEEEESLDPSVLFQSRLHKQSSTFDISEAHTSSMFCTPEPASYENRRRTRATKVEKFESTPKIPKNNLDTSKRNSWDATHVDLNQAFVERGMKIPRAHLNKAEKTMALLKYDRKLATNDEWDSDLEASFGEGGGEEELKAKSHVASVGTFDRHVRRGSARPTSDYTRSPKQAPKPKSGEKRERLHLGMLPSNISMAPFLRRLSLDPNSIFERAHAADKGFPTTTTGTDPVNVSAFTNSRYELRLRNDTTAEQNTSLKLKSPTNSSLVRHNVLRSPATKYSDISEASDFPLAKQVTVESTEFSTTSREPLVAAKVSAIPFRHPTSNAAVGITERTVQQQSPIEYWKNKVAAAERNKMKAEKEATDSANVVSRSLATETPVSPSMIASSALSAAAEISLAAQRASSSISEALSGARSITSQTTETQYDSISCSLHSSRSPAQQRPDPRSNQTEEVVIYDEEGTDGTNLKTEPLDAGNVSRGETRILPWHSPNHPLVIEDEEVKRRSKRKWPTEKSSDKREEPRAKKLRQLNLQKRRVPIFSGGERMIKFLVGVKEKCFEIHENVICHYSPLVKKLLGSSTAIDRPTYKFETDTFIFRRVKSSDFSLLSAWIYFENLKVQNTSPSISQMYRILNLASILEMTDLHNLLVNLIRKKIIKKVALSTKKIAYLYAMEGVVRKLLVCHCCVMVAMQGWGKDWDDLLDADLRLTVFRRITNLDERSLSAKGFVMPAADEFHCNMKADSHESGEGECSTRTDNLVKKSSSAKKRKRDGRPTTDEIPESNGESKSDRKSNSTEMTTPKRSHTSRQTSSSPEVNTRVRRRGRKRRFRIRRGLVSN